MLPILTGSNHDGQRETSAALPGTWQAVHSSWHAGSLTVYRWVWRSGLHLARVFGWGWGWGLHLSSSLCLCCADWGWRPLAFSTTPYGDPGWTPPTWQISSLLFEAMGEIRSQESLVGLTVHYHLKASAHINAITSRYIYSPICPGGNLSQDLQRRLGHKIGCRKTRLSHPGFFRNRANAGNKADQHSHSFRWDNDISPA